MDRKLRIVQYGCGKMSKYTMRYIFEKGAKVVGAFDINPKVIGKDIGTIIGCEDKGVLVSDAKEAREIMKKLRPDVCVVETMSLLLQEVDIKIFIGDN